MMAELDLHQAELLAKLADIQARGSGGGSMCAGGVPAAQPPTQGGSDEMAKPASHWAGRLQRQKTQELKV